MTSVKRLNIALKAEAKMNEAKAKIEDANVKFKELERTLQQRDDESKSLK